ncbi:unnamed protein product [Microthlaspi erraticum]|uniref:Mon2/Sec7/BIG1-like dimerisation and cyclophilin-binding domain-containing protein n=1 Tax=Microthlaspi erraticum TaxID=1685480 RepID=A0A6D2KUU2_9BRAS|nr:unnamed protein product [Microthlaspi erraticum]
MAVDRAQSSEAISSPLRRSSRTRRGGNTRSSLPNAKLLSSGLVLPRNHLLRLPLINACGTGLAKIVEPAIGCIQKLIAHGYIRGEADTSGGAESILLFKLIESVGKCHDLGDESIELPVINLRLCYLRLTPSR